MLLLLIPVLVFAQDYDLDNITPGRFDQGKMWTFENPPLEYFKEAYDFQPDAAWMEDARKSALRFATWCSASFVSADGLIMTNHHCSRGVVASVMQEDENFDNNGFYAVKLEDERRVEDLFVDQMVMVADITDEVKAYSNISPDSALSAIQAAYAEKEEWKGLQMETRTFYSGGKYSLYGFKRYNDIRLVLYPELALGYYGGDPDNFTYPRYNLDFTFWRAYDDEGNPLKPDNFYSFNPDGADENEAVFIVGNPGSTGRYLTMSQLYFQRDIQAPAILSFLQDRMEIFDTYAKTVEDVYKKDSVVNLYFSYSNGNKAYTGRLGGFNDPYLMGKKQKKEQMVRKNLTLEGDDPWIEIEDNVKAARELYGDVIFLSPAATRGKVNQLAHQLFAYQAAVSDEDDGGIEQSREALEGILKGFEPDLEKALFAAQLSELKEHSKSGVADPILAGRDPYVAAEDVIANSALFDEKSREKFFGMKASKLEKSEDPLLKVAKAFVPRFREASGKYGQVNQQNAGLQEKIMNLQFQLSGLNSPPDATFSLRIADGVVKGYEYNGTTAPYMTTYFGLYDRHYSHKQEDPWHLPERWENPPMELLKAPLNFVCTADIIGGNSGSPVINSKQEVVGLVFDGNIESLPGYFIFDDTYNRTVSVHSGGIAAALKYIYKANRLLSELNID